MATPIPAPTLQRLPLYYRTLAEAAASGTRYLTSTEVGAAVGVPPVQVRKDLSHLDERGKPGVGYDSVALAARLASLLGLTTDKQVVIVPHMKLTIVRYHKSTLRSVTTLAVPTWYGLLKETLDR